MLRTAATLLFAELAHSAVPADRVVTLPGYPGPLPSKHYSGYLPVGTTSGKPGFIHYWLIMCEFNPASAPLVYWTKCAAPALARPYVSPCLKECLGRARQRRTRSQWHQRRAAHGDGPVRAQ